jgi:HK97 family phage major capsid protein
MFVQLTRDVMGRKAGDRLTLPDETAAPLLHEGSAVALPEDLSVDPLEQVAAGIVGSVQNAVEKSLEQFAQAQTLSRKNAIPKIFGPAGSGDPRRTFGRFLLAVRHSDRRTLEELGSRFVEWEECDTKTMSTQTGTSGGYLVPTEFHARLMQLVAERSIVRPRATLIPMAGRSCQIPALDVTSSPAAGNSAFLGGVIARWTEEATALNETEPSLRQIDLNNYELSGYSRVSNTLLADSAVGLEAFLMQLFSRAIAWYEDHAFLRGNGVARPLGVLNWPGLIAVTRSASSAFSLADAATMYARLLPGYDPRYCCWVIHPTVLSRLLQMAAGDNAIFLGNDATGRPRMRLFGLDIEVSEKLPALNTLGDVLLCDFQHYLVGDRQQLEIAYSEHVAFLSNQAVWRFVSRVGGQPWMRSAITLSDGVSTLAPFVALSAG